MNAMKEIIQRYGLTAHEHFKPGVLEWRPRMGVHNAFHQNPLNIFLHATFSIISIWAAMLMLYPINLPGINIFSQPVDVAMVLIGGLFIVYVLMDWLTAIVLTGLYSAAYLLCPIMMDWLGGSVLLMELSGVMLTVLALAVQVFVGHNIGENGIDDAKENIQEMLAKKNPIYFMLLPFYCYLDLFFKLGYKPNEAKIIYAIIDELRPILVAENENRKPLN